MRDPYLEAVLDAAERGDECPRLWLALTSGDLVVGTPRPSRVFVEATPAAITANVDMTRMTNTRQLKERQAEAAKRAYEVVALLRGAVEPSEGGRTITLGTATVVRSGGESATIPAIRVDLDSITAWWLASAKFKREKDFLVGVVF